MSRPVRILIENAYYHVINRGQDKRNIFLDDKDCNEMSSSRDLTPYLSFSVASGAIIGGAGAAFSHAAIATGATLGEAAVGSQIFLFSYEVGANAIYNQYSSGSSTSITALMSSSGGRSGK